MPDDSAFAGLADPGAPPPLSPLGPVAEELAAIPADAPVRLVERPMAGLWQMTAWPDAMAEAGAAVAAAIGAPAPGPGCVAGGSSLRALRIAPRRCWLVAEAAVPAPSIPPAAGTLLDLGHARCRIVVSGPSARALMRRLVAPDTRERALPAGRVASMPLHHVGVTLETDATGIAVYLPRSHARALTEVMLETARPFVVGTLGPGD
ncbi:MAG: hypothetical protein AAFR52_21385 [Pseudomonadota bacterium]